MATERGKGPEEKFCHECGDIIRAKAEICPKCGVRQFAAPAPAPAASSDAPNRLVAALLAIFLGTFGAHQFYLGRRGQGVFYLLFCWTGLPTLTGILEGLIYLSMSEAAFSEKYGQTPSGEARKATAPKLTARSAVMGLAWTLIALFVAGMLSAFFDRTKPARTPVDPVRSHSATDQ
jgi:TM2 domain-containing membrane protein YozV